MFDLTISIVLYNTPAMDIQGVLNCITKNRLNYHLFFVDHSPTPSEILTHSTLDRITYIHNPLNPGFGGGHNTVIREVLGNTICHLVLNADTQFDPAVLEDMFAFMVANPDVGLLSPKVLSEEGTTQRLCKLLPTPIDVFFRRFIPIPSILNAINERYELAKFPYNRIAEVPNLSGCFMFFRSEALETVGGFDTRFFMYFEDIDLCRRINDHYRILFYPAAIITHIHGKASYKNLRMLAIHARSACSYFSKWGWFIDTTRRHRNSECIRACCIVGLEKVSTHPDAIV
jgi:hypothetical protein